MVIDDDQLDLFVAEKILTKEGLTNNVISVDSAMEAINYLEQQATQNGQTPGLIFLDITMPEIDGFEFLELYGKLNKDIRKRNVVVLSSTLDSEDIARAKANPYVIRFMQKPITKYLKELEESRLEK